MLSRCLPLPAHPLREGMVEPDSTGPGAHGNTASPIPAFLRVEGDRGFALFRIGNQEIYLAYIYTDIASIADIRVK